VKELYPTIQNQINWTMAHQLLFKFSHRVKEYLNINEATDNELKINYILKNNFNLVQDIYTIKIINNFSNNKNTI
jgi:hypothetical protein